MKKKYMINNNLTLKSLSEGLKLCKNCNLYQYRSNPVFGAGNESAKIMFIGEAPGVTEDKAGLPFIGRAGNELTNIITSVGLKRKGVYITNIVKCRPPNNRKPTELEIISCLPYLNKQILAIQPKLIIALGITAAKSLLFNKEKQFLKKHFKMSEASGDILKVRFEGENGLFCEPNVLITYHPSYLIRGYRERLFNKIVNSVRRGIKIYDR